MNLIAAPCFMLLCIGGLYITCIAVLLPACMVWPLEIMQQLTEAFCMMIRFVGNLPYVAVPAYCDFLVASFLGFALLVFIWVLWPKPSAMKLGMLSAGVSVILVLIIGVVPSTYSDEVIMLDVGQGDAFLVRSHGASILIDTGTDDSALLAALGRHRVYRLDALVISHADDDHCGSLPILRSFVEVDRVCLADSMLECKTASCKTLVANAQSLVGEKGITLLKPEDTFRVGAFLFEVIWPDEFKDDGGNSDSLSLLMSKQLTTATIEDREVRAEQTMLFCGDAEADELMAMVEKGRLGAVDVYKVAHHGSKNALSEKLAAILKPRLALVSVGQNNRYGHPAAECLTILESTGAEILRTDTQGDVVCEFKDERLAVRSLR